MSDHAAREDSAEVADLCRSYRAQLVSYAAARWTRNRHDAEDAVQEAFEFALGAYATIRPTNPRAWLYAVVRRRAQAVTRGYNLVPTGDTIENQTAPEPDAPDPDDAPTMADPDTALYVLAALDLLPPRQREALALWALDGLSWAEVADRMGITQASARHAGYTSLRRLRNT